MNGIDVSYSQKSIDWVKVRASGVQFAIIRAGYGDDPAQEDEWFARHITGAIAAGLPAAVYWFSYAGSEEDARAEWEACRQVIAPYREKIAFAAFDYEYASAQYYQDRNGCAPSGALISRMAQAFLSAAEADGMPALLYTNNDYRRNVFSPALLAEWPLWLADYTGGPDAPCAIQQTASTGLVDGIDGNVDLDVCRDDSLFDTPAADAYYRVRAGGVWLPEVCSLGDFAGSTHGKPITDFCLRVSAGSVKYRAHVLGGEWLPWVTGCDTGDAENGYAGNGSTIDAVQIYYFTPEGARPFRRAEYRIAPADGEYYGWQLDDLTSGGMDGYAGVMGVPAVRLQICIE
jgi:GH25 family lysozyme M1 (1,4-beta-N-acetylmuramidase)